MTFLPHCSNIEELAVDRPLESSELHSVNGYYGHAHVIKRFVGLPEEYPLKVMLEHSPGEEFYIWPTEEKSALPVLCCSSARYAEFFNASNKGGKTALAIGPVLSYLDTPAPPRDGTRTLVFFPLHSTHHITAEFDAEGQLREMEPLLNKFDRLVACVYWKDVLLGRHELYRSHGFHCVTAGHMYDPGFLYRLADIIRSADLLVSGLSGTEICYAALLGTPALVRRKEFSMSYDSEAIAAAHAQNLSAKSAKRDLMGKVFSTYSEELIPAQVEFVEDLCGVRNVKTRGQMRAILAAAEKAYCLQRGLPVTPPPFSRG
ncbi:hypothetical protein [Desulfocurvus sp. DL9XJH121]